MSDTDNLQIDLVYNNNQDYSLWVNKTSIESQDQGGKHTDAEELLTSAQDLTASFADLWNEVDVSWYKKIRFYLTVDINSSNDPRFKFYAKHESGGSEEYPLSDADVTIHTDNTYTSAAASRYFELNDDANQLVAIDIDVKNITGYIQTQASVWTVGGTAAQIDAFYIVKWY